MTGSRIALLGSSTLIFARMHHRRPSSVPFFISSNRAKFCSTVASRFLEAIPSQRSWRIYNKTHSLVSLVGYDILKKTNLRLFSIICVSLPVLNDLDRELVELVEVVGSVRDAVACDLQKTKIFQDRFLELGLIE